MPGDELFSEGPFVDAMGLVRCLDLVVCVDTALGHLAGALGVPTWVALAAVSDWRWLLGREGTPWYPSTRLFRQRALGDWQDVFARMASGLGRLVAEKKHQSSRADAAREND